MNRLYLIAIWAVVIMGAAFTLYRVKYEVQSLKAQVVAASLEITQEKELLHVEAAEWAYLNRPEHLRKLADKYLSGKNLTVDQVAVIEAISFHKQAVAIADNIDVRSPAAYRNGSGQR